MKKYAIAFFIVTLPFSSHALKAMTDDQVKQNIIDGWTSSYKGDCACPENKDPKGNRCGDSSAYFRNNPDNLIKCYPADVTETDIEQYREEFNIPVL